MDFFFIWNNYVFFPFLLMKRHEIPISHLQAQTILSNGMGLFRTKGQKFLHCPGTKGQQDKLKILPWHETGRYSLSKSGTGHGMGQSLFFFRAGFDFNFILNFKSVVIFSCTQPKTKRPVTLEKVSQPHSARDRKINKLHWKKQRQMRYFS